METATETKTLTEVLAADKLLRQLTQKSEKLAEKRFSFPIGTSRARVTTANAKWARVAEARDRRERDLRAQFGEAR